MKVLLLNSLYAPNIVGGAERSVQFLAESLRSSGHEAVVVSLHPGKTAEIGDVAGVRVHYLPLRNVYWPFHARRGIVGLKTFWHALDTHNPWMSRQVVRILKEERPDLVHTNNLMGFSTAVWPAIRVCGYPLVHTIRDHYLLCPRTTMFARGRNCTRPCASCGVFNRPRKHRSQYVDAVIGISKYILRRHLGTGCFCDTPVRTVIYNAYEPPESVPRSAAADLPLRLGYLGRLEPEKGIEVLLEALGHLPEGAWELWVAGRGTEEYEAGLRQRFPLANVRYLGFVPTHAFFPRIHVLVVPSLLHESLGRGVLEASAHGVGVLASNRGGIPEIVEHGQTGFLFDPDRQGELLSLLRMLLSEPDRVRSMATCAAEKARLFSATHVLRQTLEVYQQVLARSPRTASLGTGAAASPATRGADA